MNTSIEEAPPVAVPASLWEDFVDIYYAPRDVFRRRSAGKFGLALLVLTLLMTGLFYISQIALERALEAEFQRAMAGAGGAASQIDPEQLERMRSMSGLFGTLAILVTFPIGVLLTGLVAWGIGKLVASAATVGAAIMVATYAQFPRLLGSLAAIAQGLLFDPDSLSAVSVGPARFVDPDTVGPLVVGLLGRLDLFVLWSTVLIAIGLQVVGRLSRGRSYLVAAIVWILASLPVLFGALAGGMR